MGSRLFEERLELDIALVEARYPSLAQPEAYPLPFLTPTATVEKRTFRAWVLENDLVRVEVLPALGGRIWSIFDKRASVEVLPLARPLKCQSGGLRGSFLDAGIQLRLSQQDRRNSLGPVQVQAEPEGEGISTLWLGEIEIGTGLSFHAAISLADDEASITLEFRVLNRTLRAVPYHPSLSAYFPGGVDVITEPGCAAIYDRGRDCGIAIHQADSTLDHSTYLEDRLSLARFAKVQTLAPRQTDQWSVKILPLSGLGQLTSTAPTVSLGIGSDLVVQTAQNWEETGKILLETRTGENLEASASLRAESRIVIPLEGDLSDPRAVAVRPSKGDPLLVWAKGQGVPRPEPVEFHRVDWPCELPSANWRRLTFSPVFRYLANLQLAISALGSGDGSAAYRFFESSLMFNADDPLAWWGKAVSQRVEGTEEGENSSLLNAHYLAPLEPMLRAESFLSQSQEMGKEASPLLASLSLDEFTEVACLLIEHKLLDQAARLLDEALRHGDCFQLRYLLAFCYLTGSRLAAEAAQQVEIASKLPDEPPYPWRPIERKVLLRLRADFPGNEPLRRRLELLELYFTMA